MILFCIFSGKWVLLVLSGHSFLLTYIGICYIPSCFSFLGKPWCEQEQRTLLWELKGKRGINLGSAHFFGFFSPLLRLVISANHNQKATLFLSWSHACPQISINRYAFLAWRNFYLPIQELFFTLKASATPIIPFPPSHSDFCSCCVISTPLLLVFLGCLFCFFFTPWLTRAKIVPFSPLSGVF